MVVLSSKDYQQLTGRKLSFLEFMASSPLAGLDLELERDRSPARPVTL